MALQGLPRCSPRDPQADGAVLASRAAGGASLAGRSADLPLRVRLQGGALGPLPACSLPQPCRPPGPIGGLPCLPSGRVQAEGLQGRRESWGRPSPAAPRARTRAEPHGICPGALLWRGSLTAPQSLPSFQRGRWQLCAPPSFHRRRNGARTPSFGGNHSDAKASQDAGHRRAKGVGLEGQQNTKDALPTWASLQPCPAPQESHGGHPRLGPPGEGSGPRRTLHPVIKSPPRQPLRPLVAGAPPPPTQASDLRLSLPPHMRCRAARPDAVGHAGLPHELADLHLQQRQHPLHHGHLHQDPPAGKGEGAHDRGQVRWGGGWCSRKGRGPPEARGELPPYLQDAGYVFIMYRPALNSQICGRAVYT